MTPNIASELIQLQRMTVDQLRIKYAEVFGEPTGARHKKWLIKRIAWRMQALSEGGLSDRARARAAQLVCEADLRLSPPKGSNTLPVFSKQAAESGVRNPKDHRLPVPGTVITRLYKGNKLQVTVLAGGFEYEGQRFNSLSGLAKRITGSHCNGYQFFRLVGGEA